MNAAPILAPPHEGRLQPRTHLFVAATLYADAGSSPVHIRNMSPSGALIEAPVLPLPGARVAIKRGSLHAQGRIAWQVNRRAGVAFEAMVNVADWMARPAGKGQAWVDAVVSGYKAGSARHVELAAPDQNLPSNLTVEAELEALKAELAALSDGLIGDPIVVATHPEIQTLDIALQRIDRILLKLGRAA